MFVLTEQLSKNHRRSLSQWRNLIRRQATTTQLSNLRSDFPAFTFAILAPQYSLSSKLSPLPHDRSFCAHVPSLSCCLHVLHFISLTMPDSRTYASDFPETLLSDSLRFSEQLRVLIWSISTGVWEVIPGSLNIEAVDSPETLINTP